MPVHLTKRGWLTLLLAVASFGVAMANLSLAACVLSALTWAILPASFLLSLGSMRHLKIQREASSDGTMGHALSLPISVSNGLKRWRQALVILEDCDFVEEGVLVTAVPPLGPGEKVTLKRVVMAARRGEYQLCQVRVRGGDPAGLFYRERVLDLPLDLVIYPSRVNLRSVPLQLRHRVVASATGQAIGVSGVGQEFFGVRPYRPTDGMRVIHWKASARMKTLMVREFEENQIHQVSIVLDTSSSLCEGKNAESNMEMLVTAAASLVEYLGGVHCRLLLGVADGDQVRVISGTGPESRREMMRFLASIEATDLDLMSVMESVIEQVPPSSVFYCLSLGDMNELSGAMDMLLRQRVDIRSFVAPSELFARRRRLLKNTPDVAVAYGPGLEPLVLGPGSELGRILEHG